MSESADILIVDDEPSISELITALMRNLGHRPRVASCGSDAIRECLTKVPDLITLDLGMPDFDGLSILKVIRNEPELQHTPVLVISANSDNAAVAKCLSEGADDFLVKPFNCMLLEARIDGCLRKKRLYDMEMAMKQQVIDRNAMLEECVHAQVRQLASAQHATIFALSKLTESRDPETGDHLERMREYCRLLAKDLQKHGIDNQKVPGDFAGQIYFASPLHDIGKVGIPDCILQKPGKLTAEEFNIMKYHTVIGAQTLRDVEREHPGNDFIRMGIQIAESHHENWDGTGYPYRRQGTEIPLAARITALADTYDALRSKRCYKDAFSHEKARAIILEEEGKRFDPAVVAAFLRIEEDFQRVANRFHHGLDFNDTFSFDSLTIETEPSLSSDNISIEIFSRRFSNPMAGGASLPGLQPVQCVCAV